MSTHAVNVIRVERMERHPNADKLDLVHIDGFTCAVRRGDFNAGDLGVYIEPDFVVPTDRPQFAFLGENKRIKSRRLRGVWSQGLLMPLSDFPGLLGVKAGECVMERLGITRYEPPMVGEHRAPRNGSKLGNNGAERPHASLANVPVYDLENLRKHNNELEYGESVVVSEKLHGCVPSGAAITMADGTRRRMCNVEVGDYVLGVDADGRAVASKVLRKFDNGPAVDGWVKIVGQRRKAGRGSSIFALKCTPNHRVWCASKNEYVEARSLAVGDQLTIARSEMEMTPIQRSVLLGKLLGDGCLTLFESTASVSWSHSESDGAYLEWTARGVGGLAGNEQAPALSGYGTTMRRQRTVSSALVKSEFGDFIRGGVKVVPEWVADALDPLAIAFWYMDDGSLAHHDGQEDRANFAVCAFTETDCAVLQRGLRKFGIESVFYVSGAGHSRLRVDSDSAERLFLLVAPYVPPCMERKLPLRYRGHAGWLPNADGSEYKHALVTVTISSIEADDTIKSRRYDMETETHNYFAYGIRVHNCNMRVAWRGGRLWVGSRTQWKRGGEQSWWSKTWTRLKRWWNNSTRPNLDLDKGNVWWRVVRANPWIEAWCKANPECVLFGEVFGEVQDLRYGAGPGELFFRAFDVMRDGKFIDAIDFIESSGLTAEQRVPVLYVGPYSKAMATELSLRDSTLAAHMSEGVVVKPLRERSSRGCGRVALKLVSDRYLSR
jgi:RNA ligase (TIGR02306 family)